MPQDHEKSSSRQRAAVVGQSFGAYTFFHVIAEGGMGVIFKAEHTAISRRVALKIVNPKYAAREGFSPALVEVFMREARIMGAVEHPNVVTLYDAGVVGQCPYIAMRLVEGGDLAGQVANHGPYINHQQTLLLMAGIADGISAFHRAGYLNRDIKPANILLEQDGTPRIADFGLAIRTGATAEDGIVAGTPSYLAPEQVHGMPLTERTDLFALGATLYFAVTGRPPFDGPTPEAVAAEVGAAVAPPFLDLGEDHAALGLAEVIRHCMAIDPDDRYASAVEVAEDCRAIAAGQEPRFLGHNLRRRRSTFFGLFRPPGNAPA